MNVLAPVYATRDQLYHCELCGEREDRRAVEEEELKGRIAGLGVALTLNLDGLWIEWFDLILLEEEKERERMGAAPVLGFETRGCDEYMRMEDAAEAFDEALHGDAQAMRNVLADEERALAEKGEHCRKGCATYWMQSEWPVDSFCTPVFGSVRRRRNMTVVGGRGRDL